MNTALFLADLRKRRGNCVLDPETGPHSYAEVCAAAEANRDLLLTMGLLTGDDAGRLAIAVDVALGWRVIPLLLAALELGVTVVPIDPHHSPKQTEYILSTVKVALLADRQNVWPNGQLDREKLTVKLEARQQELADVALLLYTSGTTGQPKGVMLTEANIWSNVADILDYFALTSEDRLLILRPLTNASALTGELLIGLASGCAITVREPERAPLAAFSWVEKMGLTVMAMTPTVAVKLGARSKRYDLSTLRLLVLSGERLLHAQLQKIRTCLPGIAIWNAYGLTEASPRVSCLTEQGDEQEADCVGRPLAHVQVKIVDENGCPQPDGVAGELLVAGPNVMKGYYRDEATTTKKQQAGWLLTGDRARIRNGLLFLEGRMDHMMIRGGTNIHPSEIEGILLQHPDVTEVLVFGVEEESLGQAIHAHVVTEQLEAHELRRWLMETNVEPRIWPDVIERKAQLPKTATGKLMRPVHQNG